MFLLRFVFSISRVLLIQAIYYFVAFGVNGVNDKWLVRSKTGID